MTSPFTRGGDSGSPAFGHSMLSSGDDLPEAALSKKRRFSGRRKNLKVKKAKTRSNALLDATNNSDASVEDAEAIGDGARPMDDSSEDEDDKPNSYTPSGSTRKSAMAKYKLKRHSINTPQRQTGRKQSSSLSPRAVRNALSSPYRTRTSEKVRFDLENVDKRSPTPVDDEAAEADSNAGNLTDNLHSDSDNDDALYDAINLISDSDAEEENDEVIEDMETQFLIQHLEESGELPEESAFSDLYNELEESAHFDNTESDLDNFFAIPTTELTYQNDASATSENSPIIAPEIGSVFSVEMENAIDLLPTPSLGTVNFKLDSLETGLHTPASLPQSIIMRDYDDPEATEDEEPKVHSVSGARLQRVAGLGPSQATPSRVRKSHKQKTPKRGSFKISKKATVIKHDKDGKLIISKRGKVAASGTITPKGLLTCESTRQKPIPLADPLIRAISAPSSALNSPTVDRSFFPSFPLQESPFLKSEAGLIGSPFVTSEIHGPAAEQQVDELFKEMIDPSIAA